MQQTALELKKRRIGSGELVVPVLGHGGAALGGLYRAVEEKDAKASLCAGLDAGLTYVDTAPYYGFGRSERVVGDVLRGRSYVLSTKVGRLLRPGPHPNPEELGWPDALPFHPEFDYSYDGIMRSYEDSLQRLGLDRIDILYVHDIGSVTHGSENERHFRDLKTSGYRALDELRHSGAIKAIGLGVNEAAICREALKIGHWDVFLLAGRYTLLEQDPLGNLFPECAAAGTSIVIGGPFNSGILSGGNTFDYGVVPRDVRNKVQALQNICKAFDVPLAAAALQFPLAHPVVASVIPGSRSPGELNDILDWARLHIPKEFWERLKTEKLLDREAPIPVTNPYIGSPD